MDQVALHRLWMDRGVCSFEAELFNGCHAAWGFEGICVVERKSSAVISGDLPTVAATVKKGGHMKRFMETHT